jgi:hypothetical protein
MGLLQVPAALVKVRRVGHTSDLFTRLPAAKIGQIGEFTPRAWASASRVELL